MTESITSNGSPWRPARYDAAVVRVGNRVPDGEDWLEELGHGMFNVAYRLRLRDGYQAVLKIAPPPARVEVMTYEIGAMSTELTALALIRGSGPAFRCRPSTTPTRATTCATPTTSSCRTSMPTISR